MGRLRFACAILLATLAIAKTPPSGDPDTFGANIQRTMTLLATSTPERRNPVRVLVYGQSISKQTWWKTVAESLRKRFPNADLTMENRAIGGFASPLLIKTAEHDLYPYYPDLVIFHVYGPEPEYEQIIANIRKRTISEVLIFSDHIAAGQKDEWHDRHSMEWLPQIAFKYGCELAEVRRPWRQYLQENHLEPKALLRDNVHLNDRGNALLAELVEQHLRYRPELSNERWIGLVTDLPVNWDGRRFRAEFEGNRIDLVGPATGKVRVRIDGRKPSEIADLYTITRPSDTIGVDWPGVIRVTNEKPPLAEKWTLKILEINEAADKFRYEVTGETTGHDGYGNSDVRFVSKSKRIVIDPADFYLKRGREYTKKPVPPGFEIKWEVKPLLSDEWTGGAVTLGQGLETGRHRVELIAEGTPPPNAFLRIYRPPVDAHIAASEVRIIDKDDRWTLTRNGKPYFIQGAVGAVHLEELAAAGGNSIRADAAVLDKAHLLGLTVTVGLPAGKQRTGFDYANPEQVKKQEDRIREIVTQYKNHPAVLMWAIGNELEIQTTPQQRGVLWKEINRLAEVIKSIDPNHPVITPIGDAYKRMLGELNEYCPALDAVGLNAYNDMLTLPEDIKKQGWTRPYVVTEFGPRGHWQVPKTSWKVPIEDTSTEKADFYLRAYRHAVEHRPQALGAYVFHWAQHHEKTHTWYGMFLPDGSRTEAVDVMHNVWRKEWPANRAPQVSRIRIDDADGIVKPGATVKCEVAATDPEGQPLDIVWELRPDVADNPNVGGDREEPVEPIAGAVVKAEGGKAEIRIPEKPGKYRIFVYAYDPGRSAATANVPLLAEAPK